MSRFDVDWELVPIRTRYGDFIYLPTDDRHDASEFGEVIDDSGIRSSEVVL
jgi:hypothetical protein